ncbi:hypothetical protein SAMN05216383_13512 [Prevotella sp. KH2C16]|nr:hypothetical protein SAMN05216383_13512 [Prevotella sp. KH2C16]
MKIFLIKGKSMYIVLLIGNKFYFSQFSKLIIYIVKKKFNISLICFTHARKEVLLKNGIKRFWDVEGAYSIPISVNKIYCFSGKIMKENIIIASNYTSVGFIIKAI